MDPVRRHSTDPLPRELTTKRTPVSLATDPVRLTAPSPPSLLAKLETSVQVDLSDWMAASAARLAATIDQHGAVLLRGFRVDEGSLATAVATADGPLLDYTDRSTPRRAVVGRVYTSTDYPARESIPLHNEMSYAAAWPRRLWFLCLRPASSGGATPVASSRAVWEAIPASLRDRFERHGVRYHRRFSPHLDLSWQEAFQTHDRHVVAERCRDWGVEHRWSGPEQLETTAIRAATIVHDRLGQVWFNQAHLFHSAALDSESRAALLEAIGHEDLLPRAASFGDGSPISAGEIDAIQAAYDACSMDVEWHRNDLVLLDNEAMAHGRRPFTGDRRVVVAMSRASADAQAPSAR
jgi:alpha-ketoglutarate-dependent taurine dioxygenase